MSYARSYQASPKRELAARTLARRRLLDFTTYTYKQYQPEPVHALIGDALENVLAGHITKLMIFAPPQSGKSELVSVRFPAFWLSKRPESPIILTSYGADLAHSKSKEVLSIIQSPTYQILFPGLELDPKRHATQNWKLHGHRGGMVAAGVGGPITGHGAILGIIDDPFENWEAAQSPTVRKRVWENGAIILIMTRWHADDLAGRILEQQGAEWTVLRLPATAESQRDRELNDRYLGLPVGEADPLGREEGEPLCPARFSADALAQIRHDVGSMVWSAEYQGVPRPAEGNQFKRHWFPVVEAAPVDAQRIRYWDKAGTEDGGDYTAGVLMAEAQGLYYVEDVVRGQWSAHQRETIIRQTAELDAGRHGNTVKVWLEQEPGSGGKDSATSTVRNLAGFPVQAQIVSGSKAVRATPFAAQCEAMNVRLVRGGWNGAYIEELCAFPNGVNDDQVDGSSGAFNKLALGETQTAVSAAQVTESPF